MKKILFIPLLYIIGFNSFSQNIKNIEVARISNIYINAIVHLDENNQAVDTTFFIDGEDSACHDVIEIISLHHGSLKDIYAFLNFSIIFFDKYESGTTGRFRRNRVRLDKNWGMKTIAIYDTDSGASFTDTSGGHLEKLLEKLDKWRNEKNIAYY